jgi:hypothetical protein
VNPFIISSVDGLPLLFSDFYLAVLLLAISFDDGTLAFNKIKMCVMIMSGPGYIGTMRQQIGFRRLRIRKTSSEQL